MARQPISQNFQKEEKNTSTTDIFRSFGKSVQKRKLRENLDRDTGSTGEMLGWERGEGKHWTQGILRHPSYSCYHKEQQNNNKRWIAASTIYPSEHHL
jgi:hypothetical protein